MKKIIAAFDGLKFSSTTMQYAIHIAETYGYHLVGVFLDDMLYRGYQLKELLDEEGYSDTKRKELDARDQQVRDKSVLLFRESCNKAGIEFTIHRDRNVALQELLHESMFADLLIVDKKETFTQFPEEPPTRFIRDLLADVQCPVLLVSGKYRMPDRFLFLYDGGPSAVHAVKMFSYVMPQEGRTKGETISVKPPNQTLSLPDNKLMKEFMKSRYPYLKYTVLQGFAEDKVSEYLSSVKGKPIVVLGAYRRSRVSRWFSPSMADRLMKELDLPLFIAHNK